MNSVEVSKSARLKCLNMVYEAKASHIASAFSIIDILSVLYCDVLSINPQNPQSSDRDRFILSKGHASVALYSILGIKNYFDIKELGTYGKEDSIFMNHISHKVPGVEFSTGSLGHGLPFGVGKALIAKKNKADWQTFVLMSDGEMQSGSNWESFMFASHHKLDNLIAIIDFNNFQSLTTVDKTLSIQPLDSKLNSFGWNVMIVDGHNHKELKECFKKVKSKNDKPNVIIAKTTKGKGISYMENKVEWHYKSPNDKELKIGINEIINA